MTDGLAHASASIAIGWSPWVILMVSPFDPIIPGLTLEVAMAVSCGALAGIFLTPDLDLHQTTLGKGILHRSSCLVGGLWSLLWQPYGDLIQHRSDLSHFPVLGTLLRLAYLIGIPVLAWTLLAGAFHWPRPDASPIVYWLQHQQGRWCVIGLMLSDAAHWAMDQLF